MRAVVVGAAGHGSTSASSAVVRFNFSTLQGVALAWEARHCWEHWAEHLGTTRDAAVAHYQRAGWSCSTSTWRHGGCSSRCSTRSACLTRNGTRTRSPRGFPASTRAGTGRLRGWRTTGSGPKHPTGWVRSTPRTPGTSTTPSPPLMTSPPLPRGMVPSSRSTALSPLCSGTARGYAGSGSPTATRSPRTSSSTPPGRGPDA